jgi:pyruvate, water dikinase
MLNLANPAAAFRWWRLPADGVGLARMEFVVTNHIKVHPMALINFDRLKDEEAKRHRRADGGYDDKPEYFVDRLSRGLARIAACIPKPVIVRMSDFKTNEYAGLIGGAEFEPRREPDDRLPRRVALLLAALPRRLRARVPRHPPAARGDGVRQTSS